jgi:membrane protease YdiL (CAAX protease family)
MPNPSESVASAPATPRSDGMWAPGKVDLWGPRPPAGKGSWRHRSTTPADPPDRGRIGTWGLPDVAFGFFLLVVLNVALAVLAMAVALRELLVGPGVDTSDGEALVATVLEDMVELLKTGPGVLMGGLTMWAAFFLAPWLATRNKGLRSLADDFGFRFSWGRDLLMGAVFAFSLRCLEFLVTQGIHALGVDMSTAGNTDIITKQTGAWLIINALVVAAIGAPIFEELFFRGLVFGAFLKNFTRDRDGAKPQSLFGRWVITRVGRTWAVWASFRGFLYRWRVPLAVVVSSLMFGMMHFQGSNTFGSWFVVGITTTIGLLLAVIRYRTGRLGMTICTHVLFNASGVVLALWSPV